MVSSWTSRSSQRAANTRGMRCDAVLVVHRPKRPVKCWVCPAHVHFSLHKGSGLEVHKTDTAGCCRWGRQRVVGVRDAVCVGVCGRREVGRRQKPRLVLGAVWGVDEASHGADTVVKDVTRTISGSSTRRALKSPTRVSSSSPTTTGSSAATSQTHEPTGVWQTSNHASRRTWSATVPHLTQRDAGRRRVRRERRVCGVLNKQRGGRVRRRRVYRERGLRRGGYDGGFL